MWRINSLIRLYVGFTLFTLSDRMNPARRPYSFEQWYMFYFSDLQLWERRHTDRGYSMPTYTNLLTRMDRVSPCNPAMDDIHQADERVVEVVSRLTDLAKVCEMQGVRVLF